MPHQVLVTTAKFAGYETYIRNFLRDHGCELVEHSLHRQMNEEKLVELVAPAAALVAGPEPVTGRVMDAAPLLKVINAPGVGYDHIDVEAATARRIPVCICSGSNHHAVSEMALAMMLALARKLLVTDGAMRAGKWISNTGTELWGKTLGIVGLGHISKSLALIARGLGMRVLASDTIWDITFANEHQISYVPLARLLRESDFVSLHCPLTPQTRGLINAGTLALMKPGAFLINTARGPLVDEEALAAALREKRIAGAGLDVFESEPVTQNPFIDLENVVMTSHRAGATVEAIERSLEVALLNVTRVLAGQRALYQVNEIR